MQDIIAWAAGNERQAAVFYRLAAQRFAGNHDICTMLSALADDEEDHFNLLRQTKRYRNPPPYAVAPDPVLEAEIGGLIKQSQTLLLSGNLSIPQLLETILRLEFAENNSLFLHLVAKEEGQPLIDRHLERLESFIHQHPGFDLDGLSSPQHPKWPCHMLLVEEDEALGALLAMTLSHLTWVTTVSSADRMLEVLTNQSFDAVLLEIDPEPQGRERYQTILSQKPQLENRFILYGSQPLQLKCSLPSPPMFLPKPMLMHRLIQAVESVLADIQTTKIPPCPLL